MRGCKFPGCKLPHDGHGYCGSHLIELRKTGKVTEHRPYRQQMPWLVAHVDYEGEDCLKWPFPVNKTGRPAVALGKKGKKGPAAREMCRLAHGEPPTPKHEAAHSCGNGHLGCMNPNHLSWKTPLENSADKFIHGTILFGERNVHAKLTERQVLAIREFAHNCSRATVASLFDTTESNVSAIVTRRSWAHLDG